MWEKAVQKAEELKEAAAKRAAEREEKKKAREEKLTVSVLHCSSFCFLPPPHRTPCPTARPAVRPQHELDCRVHVREFIQHYGPQEGRAVWERAGSSQRYYEGQRIRAISRLLGGPRGRW
eukprot:Sspe_Gene.24509::Locus_9714_Transcript_7_7_Confidence_0.621_Length_2038::g.24509::m.24509